MSLDEYGPDLGPEALNQRAWWAEYAAYLAYRFPGFVHEQTAAEVQAKAEAKDWWASQARGPRGRYKPMEVKAMNLVERVARLLCNDADPDEVRTRTPILVLPDGTWQNAGPEERIALWITERARARQILEAMREPSETMKAKLAEYDSGWIGGPPRAPGDVDMEKQIIQEMVDAELAADLEQHGQP